tara:strand:- start:3196 stop:4314 length:1119 start_codon:yes stop_codon:yes gene_type:complete
MKKIGITGQGGFIGRHLYNTLALNPEEFERIPFESIFFEKDEAMDTFVTKCDVIIHLAAMNRHNDPNIIYKTNIELVNKLILSLERTKSQAHVLISSSSQEERGNLYGKSKKEGRILLSKWAKKNNGKMTGLIIPNVFGPFGSPYYNSVIATFSYQIANGVIPKIDQDGLLKLIYVGELVEEIIKNIRQENNQAIYKVPYTAEAKVSEILLMLKTFHTQYGNNGEIPELKNSFELNMFNTYRCYINIKDHFPIKYIKHNDLRGSFVEVIRLGVGGQVSFSTTVPGVTRGNHYHTRKIERFSVIKGKALIQLRRIGTDELLDFYLDGESPSYVDMPIWYTHNIKNIGNDILYTNFWINEFYNPDDADTFFEKV